MILYANGDSHTYGTLVHPHQRFSNIVAKEFDHSIINHAIPGASNQRILRTTLDFLETQTPDFVMIGWTTWEREEWHYQGQYYDVNSAGHQLPESLKERYKNWVVKQNFDTLNKKSISWHDKIYALHKQLKDQGIKHLFFNGFYNFFHIEKHEEKDWGNNFLGPYDNDSSYYWYLSKQGYESQDYHFKQDGHVSWAKKLIQHIKEENLINDAICKR